MTGPALAPPAFPDTFHPSSWLPAAVLAAALLIKLPTIVRLRRDPLLHAIGGLLLLGCAVFVFSAPATIAWTNRLTGVPNFAAPWCYSLITAMSGACLLLTITWRDGPSDGSPAGRRPLCRVLWVYSGVIVALWVLFLFADVPVERVRDLDTYYADTPFMREEILLYLVAHGVACVINARLIRDWAHGEDLDVWLRRGLRLLGAGCALNLVFVGLKLAAVVARWCGRDLDRLSTGLAPPVAALAAVLVAAGIILPHAGQWLRDRRRIRHAHHELRPLYRLMRTVSGTGVPFAPLATPELRLTRRETFIRDALLPLARHIDADLARRSRDAALALGHPPERARALAAAVGILDAVENRAARAPETAAGHDPTCLLREIAPISRALRRGEDITVVRARAALDRDRAAGVA
ncbi:MAB_1171c family putative transporter [Streptomyces sp. NPDC040750]|uniref:MAB_1171c family putative transporter n=1 Tax=Streptomyces sp. NPDC040750 TaxID=3154491 RepID=UPI0034029A83